MPRRDLPEFEPYIKQVIKDFGRADLSVVEVGTNNQLTLASQLAGLCSRYVAVTLPSDLPHTEGPFSFVKAAHPEVELLGANALNLSRYVSSADMVILHNVALEYEDGDMALAWQIRRKEVNPAREEVDALQERFNRVIPIAFREFARVVQPAEGMIIDYGRDFEDPSLAELLIDHGVVEPATVSVTPMVYDDGFKRDTHWVATTIDFRAQAATNKH